MIKNVLHLQRFVRSSQPALLLLVIVFFGMALTLFSSAVFIHLRSEVLEQESLNFDVTVSQSIYNLRTPGLTTLMMTITNLGGVDMIYFAALFSFVLLVKKHVREALLFVFILIMGLGITIALKNSTQRLRPSVSPLIVETDFSFPSGHAMNAFVFYSTASYLVYHFTKSKKKTIVAFGLSAILLLLIGFSRVYLGVHYPTDILAGYAAGLVWFTSIISIQKTFVFYELFRERHFGR